jgi:serine protease Do
MTRGSIGRGVVSLLAAATLATSTAANVARAQDRDDGRNRRVEVIRVAGSGPRLGIDIEDVHGDDVARLKLAEERGALVRGVASGSAAEKAGLKEGDVILGYQGEKVWSSIQFRRLVRETPAGRKVSLEISRGGALQRLAASVEETRDSEMARGEDSFHFDVPMPPVPAMPPIPPIPPMDRLLQDGVRGRPFLFRDHAMDGRPGRLGFAYEEVSGQLARYFKVEDGGLLVTDVDADGPAGHAGLRAGDIVVKVQGKVVGDPDVLRRALDDLVPGTEVALSVQREGRPVELKVTPRGGGERRERGERS